MKNSYSLSSHSKLCIKKDLILHLKRLHRGGEEQNTAFLADTDVTFSLLKIAVETLKTARAVRVEVLLINIYLNVLGSWSHGHLSKKQKKNPKN